MKKTLVFALALLTATPDTYAIDVKKASLSLAKSCWHTAEIIGGAACLATAIHFIRLQRQTGTEPKPPKKLSAILSVVAISTISNGSAGLYKEVTSWLKKEPATQEESTNLTHHDA